jgi:hypothetical protein
MSWDSTACKTKSLATTINKITSQDQIHHSLPPFLLLATRRLLVGLPERSGGRIRSFPPSTSFHHGYPCSYITWGWIIGLFVAAVQRRMIILIGSNPMPGCPHTQCLDLRRPIQSCDQSSVLPIHWSYSSCTKVVNYIHSNQLSAFSFSKHWPSHLFAKRVCSCSVLPVNYLPLLPAASIVEYVLTATSFRLHASTFLIQTDSWQQNYSFCPSWGLLRHMPEGHRSLNRDPTLKPRNNNLGFNIR